MLCLRVTFCAITVNDPAACAFNLRGMIIKIDFITEDDIAIQYYVRLQVDKRTYFLA